MNKINSIGLRNTIYRTVASFTIFAFMWSASVPQAAAQGISASPASKPEAACLNNGQARSANNARTGKVNFVGTDPGRAIPNADGLPGNASPEAAARSYLARCGMLFGLTDQAAELQVKQENKLENGRSVARFQQYYQGIPVMGGELVVNLDNKKNILSVGGDIFSDIYVNIQPSISPEEAAQVALDAAASKYNLPADGLQATTPELWIYDPALFGAAGTPVLVWRVDVTPLGASSPDELTLVDTELGLVVLSFNQNPNATQPAQSATAPAANPAAGVNAASNPLKALTTTPYTIEIYSVGNECLIGDPDCTGDQVAALSPSLICNQNSLPDPITACESDTTGDAANAYQFALDAYNFYATTHGRDSIDNAGMTITAYVHYGDDDPVGYPNSRWNGTTMIFGEGWPAARDIVGHEYTHGVTAAPAHASNLYAYYQSGAIGESFSDLWGEFIDQENGDATWEIGENLPGSVDPLRDMSDPTLFSQPDKMNSGLYYTGSLDNGGIHTNSGVNNKAVYLMTDGTTDFNGSGPITGLGRDKVAQIYYEVQTNLLTSGADYADLYQALYQGCLNLVNASEITLDDCTQVQAAANAVEMNYSQSVDPYTTPDAPLCDGGLVPSDLFYDDLESGSANFIHGMIVGADEWSWGANNAHSGDTMLYANDVNTITNSYVQTNTSVTIPNEIPAGGVYLHFEQSFLFYQNYDGGVLEYSTGGAWTNAGSLFTNNGYNGTITTDETHHNPLGAVAAFVSDSHGYISSRLDLSSLEGDTVIFRWRQGTSESVSRSGVWGWYLDDIRIYTCVSAAAPGAFSKTSPANAATGQSDSITLSWGESAGATEYEYCYDTSDTCNSANTEDWIPAGTATSKDLTELTQYSTYYWQVRAKNALGTTTYANGSDTASWSFTVDCFKLTTNITTGPSTGSIAIDDSVPPEYCSTTDLFKTGSSVLLKAVPATNYKFLSWGSEGSGATSPLSVTMNKDMFISAAFTLKTFTITGNAGESGVILRYTDGTAKSVTSGSTGRYTITVPANWSGKITPSKTGLTFSPSSKTYSAVTANRTSQNYSAIRTFTSTGSYDGWITESAETSNVGGSLNATANYFILGDASADRQIRAILAFPTSTLPNTAVIQSVVIKIRQYGSPVGSNPFSILGSLYTDIRKGYFGTSISLQTSDFNAAASTSSVAATFSKTPVSSWYSATFTSTGRAYINKTSWTELRLRFYKDDNDDGGADYMMFCSGNYSSSSYRPQLIVTYTLP